MDLAGSVPKLHRFFCAIMQDDFHEDQTRQSSLDPHEITHLLASSGATVSPVTHLPSSRARTRSRRNPCIRNCIRINISARFQSSRLYPPTPFGLGGFHD